MSKQTYYEKLKDPRWQRKRLEVMERADFKCQDCGENEHTLNVHHRYYIAKREPWQYPDWCFLCLCKKCHEIRHDPFEGEDDKPECGYMKDIFEELIGFVHDGYDGSSNWDLFVEMAMAKKYNPESYNEFYRQLLFSARDLRIELSKEKA